MTTTSWCLPIICTALTYEQENKCIKLLISYVCLYPIQFSLLTVIIAWSISIIPISWIIIASIATITLLIAVSLIPITLVPVIAITLIPILTLSYRRENHPQNPILVHTTYLECVHTKVVCVVLTAASSTSASSSIATSSSTATELLLLVHFFWLCYLNLTLQIKNKEEYVKCLRAALPNLSTWRSQKFLWRQRRCTCCAPGQVSSTNAYPGASDSLCHVGKGKSLSAFPRGHCFQGILSCLLLFPTISFTMEEVLRPPLLWEPQGCPLTWHKLQDKAVAITLLHLTCTEWTRFWEIHQNKFSWQPLYTLQTAWTVPYPFYQCLKSPFIKY